MKRVILVITSSIDSTADYIINRFSQQLEFFRLNVDELKYYEVSIGNDFLWSIFDKRSNISVNYEDVKSIYYRKPMFPNLTEYESAYHEMIQSDIYSMISGIVDSFEGKVISKPSILRTAENKINQLIYAKKNNWSIPKSFIGNQTTNQAIFTKQKSIIKPLTTGMVRNGNICEIYQTNIFAQSDNDIALTPIYLQEYIEKQYEVRITVVNDVFFPVRIDCLNKIDWRKDYEHHQYSLIDIPKEIRSNCLQMLSHYGLKFGAFDFIVTPQDEWVFLELNPNGQWLWLEKAMDIEISGAIIDLLEGN